MHCRCMKILTWMRKGLPDGGDTDSTYCEPTENSLHASQRKDIKRDWVDTGGD